MRRNARSHRTRERVKYYRRRVSLVSRNERLTELLLAAPPKDTHGAYTRGNAKTKRLLKSLSSDMTGSPQIKHVRSTLSQGQNNRET